MNLDILSVLVIVIYFYLMTCVLKLKDKTQMIVLTSVLIIYLYFKNYSDKLEGYNLSAPFAPVKCSNNDCNLSPDVPQNKSPVPRNPESLDDKQEMSDLLEKVVQEPKKTESSVSPHSLLEDKMGKYDGLCLTSNGADWWKSTPDMPLNSDEGLFTPQGAVMPTKPLISEPISGNKMFMFSNNVVSPDCCPSTYSTSTGCICSTPEQRKNVNQRGDNSSSCTSGF